MLQGERDFLAAVQGHGAIMPLYGTVQFDNGSWGIVMQAADASLEARMAR